MKILLLGKDGQVGWELGRSLLPLGELVTPGRDEVDLENLVGLREFMHSHRPDLIVNAAAYTAVDKAEQDEAMACKINSEAVGVMASYATAKRSPAGTLLNRLCFRWREIQRLR